MMTTNARIFFYYLCIHKDGSEYVIPNHDVVGLYEAQQKLLNDYGIKTSTTTLGKGKVFEMKKWYVHPDKDDLMAYCNFMLFHKDGMKEFYWWEQIRDNPLFTVDNPIVDVKYGTSREAKIKGLNVQEFV